MADMAVNQIYELLAQKLEKDLNTYSDFTKFTVKASYNEQEPSKELSTINGVLTFSTNDVAPIEGLDVYTLPAVVSFVCKKEYANEVMAIVTKYIADVRGLIQPVGEYFTAPTYSTPNQSELTMAGQIGESIKISMYIDYTVFKDVLFTNDMTVEVDGVRLLFNEFGIGKQKVCDTDNVQNNSMTETIPIAQTLTFEFKCFLTSSSQFLLNEMLGFNTLTTTHTLTLTIGGKTFSYTVLMNGEVTGAVGGAMYCSITFLIADGSKGGEV